MHSDNPKSKRKRVNKPTSVRLTGDGRYALDKRLRAITKQLLSDLEARGRYIDATVIVRARHVARVMTRLEIVDAESRDGFIVSDTELKHLTKLVDTGLKRLGLDKPRAPTPPRPMSPMRAVLERAGRL